MSARRSARPGEYPNLLPLDIVSDGVLTLYRNPAGKVFGEKDAFAINVSWLLPADMSEAFNQAVDEEAKQEKRKERMMNLIHCEKNIRTNG